MVHALHQPRRRHRTVQRHDRHAGGRRLPRGGLNRSPARIPARYLPFNTQVKVTNNANGSSLIVRINDRGTFTQTPQEPKCLDLTDGAFQRLGGVIDPDQGHIEVTEEVLP
ncbi:RlpA-like double-psi beta-barrel domain-containing protein [Streptomyces sp. NPDC059101]|uniref:RlpA-like double-psi beta-barrel domain-containing protein n=1 Tax=Streptomyces sp. NPDC059101 TaxID=3346728 RepID=UPI00369216B3